MGRPRDRRVRRTRRNLKQALLGLLQERAYARITVQDILDRADVGRSTFYDHFSSKEDLLFDGFGEGLEHLGSWARADAADAGASGAGPPTPPRPFAFARPMLEHVRTQKRFFLATFFGAPDPRIRDRVTEMITSLIRRELEAHQPRSRGATSAQLVDARAHAIAAGFFGLTRWWLTVGEEIPVEEVVGVFEELAGVKS